MFGPLVEHWIICNMDCCLIVTQLTGAKILKLSFPSNSFIQTSLVVAFAIALYSTSALDLAMTFCFLLFHITTISPRLMQYQKLTYDEPVCIHKPLYIKYFILLRAPLWNFLQAFSILNTTFI